MITDCAGACYGCKEYVNEKHSGLIPGRSNELEEMVAMKQDGLATKDVEAASIAVDALRFFTPGNKQAKYHPLVEVGRMPVGMLNAVRRFVRQDHTSDRGCIGDLVSI